MDKLERLAYFSEVARLQVLYPDTPLGHLYASTLSKYPKLHDAVCNDAILDPYLSDDNIPAFIKWLSEQGE